MSRGFDLGKIDAGGQFQFLEENLNICAHEEHVSAVERKIVVIQERWGVDLSGIPFSKMLRTLVINLIYRESLWMNSFPSTIVGVSNTIGPREIMTGRKWDYKKHCSLQFGEYVQVFDKTNNSMNRITTGAIAMCLSGNE